MKNTNPARAERDATTRRDVRWSLITVTYNSEPALLRFWSDWQAPADVEWIVVDNSSTDDSANLARSLGASVIELPKNLGFGAANNRGFAAAQGRYVAFVNPDVEVDAESLVRLEECLRDSPLALVAPQLTNGDGTLQPNGRGTPHLFYKVLNRTNPDAVAERYHRYAAPGERVNCDWLMGAVVAATRERLAVLGPWDPRFFVYYEDSDLGLRNARSGGANVVVGDVRWTHGWARETITASYASWKREIPSLVKFYTRYPRLLSIPRKRAN